MENGLRPLEALRELLPPLSQDDHQRLKTDIALHGVRVPIVAGEEGILDGAHRYAIAQELGTEDVPIVHSEARGEDAVRLGLSLNLARRHLTPEQKREVIRKLRARGWTQELVAEVVGMSQSGISKAGEASIMSIHNACVPDLRVKLEPRHRAEVVARVRAGATQAQVATDYGISHQRVSQIIARAPEPPRDGFKGKAAELPQGVRLLHGDFREALKDLRASVDVIFADPPYDGDSLPLYDALGRMAAQALKVGGYLITYSGQAFLPEVMKLLGTHLTYYWVFCLPFEVRQDHLRLWGKNLWNAWKPLLIYSKGEATPHKWCADLVRVPAREKEHAKDLHKWAQPVPEAVEVLRVFTPEGGLVVDPFVGSGTTLIAAKLLGLQAIGVEKDEKTYLIAKARIAEAA